MAQLAIITSEDSLILDALLDAWADSTLADLEIVLVSPASNAPSGGGYGSLICHDIIDFDFDQVVGVIVLCPAIVVEAYQQILTGISCPLLGFMGNLACLQPVLFDPHKPHLSTVTGVLQSPVAALQYVLEDILTENIGVTAFYPASFYGAQGVQALATQATRLLNVQSCDDGVFGQQLPFNYYPMSANSAGEELEKHLLNELNQVFIDQDISVSTIQMPVFYGVSVLVSVILQDEVDFQSIKDVWLKKELISYQDSAKQLSNREVLDHNGAIILGNARKSLFDNYRFDFWMGFDDVRFSARHSLISAAEFLLKHHL